MTYSTPCRECEAGAAQARQMDIAWLCMTHGEVRLADYQPAYEQMREEIDYWRGVVDYIVPEGECYTLPNGDCVGRNCIHRPLPEDNS